MRHLQDRLTDSFFYIKLFMQKTRPHTSTVGLNSPTEISRTWLETTSYSGKSVISIYQILLIGLRHLMTF